MLGGRFLEKLHYNAVFAKGNNENIGSFATRMRLGVGNPAAGVHCDSCTNYMWSYVDGS
jgi:hypothetical protein